MTETDETVGVKWSYVSPVLLELVKQVTYKPNWQLYVAFELAGDGSGGWHFFVISDTENSMDPSRRIRVRHGFLIPPASYNRNTWAAWLFERLRDVETHEACEFFRINDVREFAPHHSNGENPYIVWHTSDYITASKKSGED